MCGHCTAVGSGFLSQFTSPLSLSLLAFCPLSFTSPIPLRTPKKGLRKGCCGGGRPKGKRDGMEGRAPGVRLLSWPAAKKKKGRDIWWGGGE